MGLKRKNYKGLKEKSPKTIQQPEDIQETIYIKMPHKRPKKREKETGEQY